MVQGVADDGIALIQQHFEQSPVRVEAGTVEDGVLGTEKVADGLFQLLVQILRAANKPDGSHTIAMGFQPILSRLHDGRMIRKSEIIVCAEIQNGTL